MNDNEKPRRKQYVVRVKFHFELPDMLPKDVVMKTLEDIGWDIVCSDRVEEMFRSVSSDIERTGHDVFVKELVELCHSK